MVPNWESGWKIGESKDRFRDGSRILSSLNLVPCVSALLKNQILIDFWKVFSFPEIPRHLWKEERQKTDNDANMDI